LRLSRGVYRGNLIATSLQTSSAERRAIPYLPQAIQLLRRSLQVLSTKAGRTVSRFVGSGAR
jgi:hypothetical protein